MAKKQENQWEPVNPRDNLTVKQRLDMERGRAWAAYINGGVGDPGHFDGPTVQKSKERAFEREQERTRKASRSM
jgi:hypothetical protein